VAAHTWCGVDSPHLVVLSDGLRSVGTGVALRLEELRQAVALLVPPLVQDADPVQVIVFRDATLAAAYAPTWRGIRDEVAGFSHSGPDRRRLVFPDDGGRTPSVAQHEYLHSLLDAAYPEVPLWLNEGLAEYFSTFTAAEGRAHAGAPLRAHLEWLEAHDLMPLRQLFAIGQTSPEYHEGDRRGTFYAQSWALTHLLLSSDGDLARLARVVVAARDGEPFEAVFQREFGSEQALHDRLVAYLERPRLPERTWPMPGGTSPPRVRDRVSPAEVLTSLAIELLSRPVVAREDAEEHLRMALALDARLPDANAGMGWLELMRGHPDQARTWFDRALERKPVSVTAVRVLASRILEDVGRRQAREERKEAALYARAAIERALAVAPGDAELTALLARTWVVWYGDDPEPGYVEALRAERALPGRMDVQLDLLALAALTGRDAEAQRIQDLRFGADAPAESRHAALTARLAGDVLQATRALARGDTTAAEARLDAARERVAGDPELAAEAQRTLDEFQASLRLVHETDQQNRAVAEYNAGVKASNGRRWSEAEAAFQRAAAISARPEFQAQARRNATRMRQQRDGERAFALARKGQVAEAIAIFEAMDRAAMSAEDKAWLDTNLARLRAQNH